MIVDWLVAFESRNVGNIESKCLVSKSAAKCEQIPPAEVIILFVIPTPEGKCPRMTEPVFDPRVDGEASEHIAVAPRCDEGFWK